MAPTKSKKMKTTLVGDSQGTEMSISNHKVGASDGVEAMTAGLAKIIQVKDDFLTHTDVVSLLEKHLYNTLPEDLDFIPKPPYPLKGEHLMDYVRCFRDLTLDCCDGSGEEDLVEICINNIIPKYRVDLENVRIKKFSKLLEAAKRTSLSVKIMSGSHSWREKKEAPHSLAISDRPPRGYPLERRKRNRENSEQPPVPCTDEEFHAILNQWIQDGVVCLFTPRKQPMMDDKKNLRYYRLHQYVHHHTTECQVLRKIFHPKINNGTLELPSKKQAIDLDPLSHHQVKETCTMVFCLKENEGM
ncbi:hypothetical protein L484_024934 [Morus notabilis]|uniref:Uncharacterized protein n=1 Tax=Morus notabilis TaxID=981085 RepID=W9R3J0_9ROSA|nr:hypothetical protein L484_024934 [Morus notabilis]